MRLRDAFSVNAAFAKCKHLYFQGHFSELSSKREGKKTSTMPKPLFILCDKLKKQFATISSLTVNLTGLY